MSSPAATRRSDDLLGDATGQRPQLLAHLAVEAARVEVVGQRRSRRGGTLAASVAAIRAGHPLVRPRTAGDPAIPAGALRRAADAIPPTLPGPVVSAPRATIGRRPRPAVLGPFRPPVVPARWSPVVAARWSPVVAARWSPVVAARWSPVVTARWSAGRRCAVVAGRCRIPNPDRRRAGVAGRPGSRRRWSGGHGCPGGYCGHRRARHPSASGPGSRARPDPPDRRRRVGSTVDCRPDHASTEDGRARPIGWCAQSGIGRSRSARAVARGPGPVIAVASGPVVAVPRRSVGGGTGRPIVAVPRPVTIGAPRAVALGPGRPVDVVAAWPVTAGAAARSPPDGRARPSSDRRGTSRSTRRGRSSPRWSGPRRSESRSRSRHPVPAPPASPRRPGSAGQSSPVPGRSRHRCGHPAPLHQAGENRSARRPHGGARPSRIRPYARRSYCCRRYAIRRRHGHAQSAAPRWSLRRRGAPARPSLPRHPPPDGGPAAVALPGTARSGRTVVGVSVGVGAVAVVRPALRAAGGFCVHHSILADRVPDADAATRSARLEHTFGAAGAA